MDNIKLIQGETLEEMKKLIEKGIIVDMIEKIQKVYDEIKHKYSNGENNTKVRLLLKTELLFELSDKVDVKCDEENNSPDILNFNCLIAKIVWNEELNGGYKYTNLVFGMKHNIGQVQFLVN